jgi:tRNA (guanine-N7-)-methyltransferase
MGEVKVLAIIVRELKKLNKALILHVSVMTEAGFDSACDMFGDSISISYFPLDYRSSIKRFLKSVQPKSVVFIETEIWPNIIHELGRRKIPVFLANGRLSKRACRRYQYFKSGLKKIFVYYKLIMLQSETDKERYLKIGVDINLIKVLGSLKFDAPVRLLSQEKSKSLKGKLPFEKESKYFIAGSTRNGEDELILNTFEKLSVEFPDLKLILAPRHLDRLDSIYNLLKKHNLSYTPYSRSEKCPNGTKVVVVDRLGVLNDLYALSDIAFVGGTLVDIGGQNILEPVWAGIPVLYGPSIYNVKDSSEHIIKNGYGEMVQDADELYLKLRLFLTGEISYKRKDLNDTKSSRAYQTAKIILESIQIDAENMAENNNQ